MRTSSMRPGEKVLSGAISITYVEVRRICRASVGHYCCGGVDQNPIHIQLADTTHSLDIDMIPTVRGRERIRHLPGVAPTVEVVNKTGQID